MVKSTMKQRINLLKAFSVSVLSLGQIEIDSFKCLMSQITLL